MLCTYIWPQTVAGQEPSDSVAILDSVQVTVLGGPTSLGRVPFPVSIIEGRELRRGNAGLSIEEALQAIPGVQINNRYNYAAGERISIRGFGSRTQFGVRGIRVIVDGIPATLPDGQSTLDHVDLGSLGRVEVLRGPAAAFYGNAGGGVISFSTLRPSEAPIQQEARVVVGENGLVRLESMTSGTRGELEYLVSTSNLSYDGFRTLPDDPSAVYGKTNRLNVNMQLITRAWDGELRVTGNFLDLAAENPGSLPRSFIDEKNFQAWNFNVTQGTRDDVRQGQLGVSWNGPLGRHSGEFSAWGIIRELDSPIPPSIIDLNRFAWGTRAVISTQPSVVPGDVQVVSGIELQAQRDDRINFNNDFGQPGALILDQLETVRSLGIFAQARARLSGRLSAVGGLRYDRFDFSVDDRLGQADLDESGDRDMRAVSPVLGLQFQASTTLAIYGNVATSFQTPTTTELVNRPNLKGGLNPELEPTRSVTREVGVRSRWSSRLLIEVNGWITKLDDELVPFEDELQPGRVFFRNAGASRYAGIEGLLHVVFANGFSGRVAYTFTDATFEDFDVDGRSFDGNLVPGIARHRVDAVLRLDRRHWHGEVRGDFVGRIAANDDNTEFARSYTILELRTGLDELPIGGLTVSPFMGVTNVFDRTYSASITINAFSGRFFEPGPGRSIFAGLGILF